MPNGATTTGFGENLMACVMFWNWRMAMSTSSHSSSCTAISSIMMLAPTEKFAASLVITKASKLSPAPPGFSVCGDQLDDVAAQRVHLGVELDAADAIAEIDQRSSGILLHHAVRLFRNRD